MCSRYAMMVSRVTPPLEEEEAEVEKVEGAEGLVVSVRGRFDQSWTSLCRTGIASM